LNLEAKKIGISKVVSKLGTVDLLVEAIREQLKNTHSSALIFGEVIQTFQSQNKASAPSETEISRSAEALALENIPSPSCSSKS